MTARESKTVILLNGSHTITAGYGIHEIFKRPSVTLTARVGLSRSTASSSSVSPPHYSQYIVGAALDEAERKGQDIAIFWPMQKGYIRDWQQMIALWNHVLFTLLPLRRSHNDSSILVSLPTPISRSTYAYLTQVFFEHFNAAAIAIVEKPLLATYGVGTMNACVIDLGWQTCDVTPIIDCLLQHNSIIKTDIGAKHCTLYLAHLLRRDQSIVKALTALLRYLRKSDAKTTPEQDLEHALYSLANQLIEEGLVLDEEVVKSGSAGLLNPGESNEDDEGNFDIAAALIDSSKKAEEEAEEERRKVAMESAGRGEELDESIIASITGEDGQAGASTDPNAVLVNFRGLKLKVGPERYRFLEPLFRPELLKDVVGADQLTVGDEPFGSGPVVPLAQPSASSTTPTTTSGNATPAVAMTTALTTTTTTTDAINVATSSDASQPYIPASFDTFPFPSQPIDWSISLALPAAISRSILSVEEIDKRPLLFENLIFTGAPAKIKTIQIETLSALTQFIFADQTEAASLMGEANPAQPRNLRALRVPDYFSEFKDRTDLAQFLGATIYAKLVFGDPYGKGFITKQNYNESGPNTSFSVKPAV